SDVEPTGGDALTTLEGRDCSGAVAEEVFNGARIAAGCGVRSAVANTPTGTLAVTSAGLGVVCEPVLAPLGATTARVVALAAGILAVVRYWIRLFGMGLPRAVTASSPW